MTQWTIPHDESHRFLKWGLMDNNFQSWVDFFTVKNIPFEVGGGGDKWTIYKHQLFVDVNDRSTGRADSRQGDSNNVEVKTRRCCVQGA